MEKKGINENKKNIFLVIIVIVGALLLLKFILKKLGQVYMDFSGIVIVAGWILIITLISNKLRNKNKKKNSNPSKEILKKLFPEYYVEEDMPTEEIKLTKLNSLCTTFFDEGTLKINHEDKIINIYKYYTIEQNNNGEINENGIMIKFLDILNNKLTYPIYIKNKEEILEQGYRIGISNVVNKLYELAGVDKQMEIDEEIADLENDEFNKHFMVQSNNAIQARMVVTFDRMEKLLELREKIGKDIELTYMNNDVYIWIDNIKLTKRVNYKFIYNQEAYNELKEIIKELPNIEEYIKLNEI